MNCEWAIINQCHLLNDDETDLERELGLYKSKFLANWH